MIPNSMTRYPPPPTVPAKPVRIWKSLGMIARDRTGYVEAHYELKTFRGDLDVDTEADLRTAAQQLLMAVQATGHETVSGDTYELQRRRGGPLLVRLVIGEPGEEQARGRA